MNLVISSRQEVPNHIHVCLVPLFIFSLFCFALVHMILYILGRTLSMIAMATSIAYFTLSLEKVKD